jgi:hypothetical protein
MITSFMLALHLQFYDGLQDKYIDNVRTIVVVRFGAADFPVRAIFD